MREQCLQLRDWFRIAHLRKRSAAGGERKFNAARNASGTAGKIFLDGSAGVQTIDYADVKDNNATGGQELVCDSTTESCTNGGNTTNWDFGVLNTITGTLYQGEGASPLSGKTVSLSSNGGAVADNAVTDGGGQFTLSGAGLAKGDTVTIFVNDGTATGALVVVASGGSMTGMHIYRDRLIVRNATGGVILGNHVAIADGSADPDVLAVFSENAGVLNVKNDREMLVW